MWKRAIAVIAVCAVAGCGRGENDDEKPPPNSRAPHLVEKCLRADGFTVRATASETREDRNAPDYSIIVTGEQDPALVGFYSTTDRARKLLRDVRANTERIGGVLDEGGRAAIFWSDEPDARTRDRVWACVFIR
jgi:hypothetical protein